MPKERQTVYRGRLGIWYEDHRLYLHAMTEYRQNGDYDAMLRTLQKDAGILLSSLHPKGSAGSTGRMPGSCAQKPSAGVLVLMRSMFNWRNNPENAGAEGAAADGEFPKIQRFPHRKKAICGENAT